MTRHYTFDLLVNDLDRCEHGRHEGDVCSGVTGCNGPSLGNPLHDSKRGRGDQRIWDRLDCRPHRLVGFTISAEPIIDPGRELRHDPAQWIAPRNVVSGALAPSHSPDGAT